MSSTITMADKASSLLAFQTFSAQPKSEGAMQNKNYKKDEVNGVHEFKDCIAACIDSNRAAEPADVAKIDEGYEYVSSGGGHLININKLDEYMDLVRIHLIMLDRERMGIVGSLPGGIIWHMSPQERESMLANLLRETGVLNN